MCVFEKATAVQYIHQASNRDRMRATSSAGKHTPSCHCARCRASANVRRRAASAGGRRATSCAASDRCRATGPAAAALVRLCHGMQL